MFIRLILALICLTVLFYFYKKIKKSPPGQRKKTIISVCIYTTIGLVLLAAFTGRLHWFGIIPAAVAGVMRFGVGRFVQLMPIFNFLRANADIKNPEFATPNLRVEWNVKTGEIRGKVLTGEYADKELHALTDIQLEQLLETYKADDKKSYYILTFFIQKSRNGAHAENAQGRSYNNTQDEHNYSPPNNDQLTTKEAYEILGITKDASKKEVNSAYKRLMQKLHPDRGGNPYLASRVNLARDHVLKNMK